MTFDDGDGPVRQRAKRERTVWIVAPYCDCSGLLAFSNEKEARAHAITEASRVGGEVYIYKAVAECQAIPVAAQLSPV